MNWDAIAAISQVVGTVAGVATLIYLAIQIRHQSDKRGNARLCFEGFNRVSSSDFWERGVCRDFRQGHPVRTSEPRRADAL